MIVVPVLGFKIADICLSFIMFNLITLRFLIKKIGKKLKFPNGPNLLISWTNLLLMADKDISKSYLFELLL